MRGRKAVPDAECGGLTYRMDQHLDGFTEVELMGPDNGGHVGQGLGGELHNVMLGNRRLGKCIRCLTNSKV